jgi:glycogen debranching enzyme
MTGFYFREARFLRRCSLQLSGEDPWLCEAAPVARDTLHFAYAYPEVGGGEGGGTGQSGDEIRRSAGGLPERAIELLVTQAVATRTLAVRAMLVNRSREPVTVDVSWQLDADFADIQEAYSGTREQNAPVAISDDGNVVTFAYEHAQLPYRTRVTLPAGFSWRAQERRAALRLTLEPQQSRLVELRAEADAGDRPDDDDHQTRAAAIEKWRGRFTRVTSSNTLAASIVAANVEDFAAFPLVDGPRDEWLALQAGVPHYPAFFGRDAVTAGWQAAMIDRGDTLTAALLRLGRLQSDRTDDWRDAQPGRIPYQVRRGPLAQLNLNPFGAYYADFASPLMFVISLANLFAWSGDRGHLDAHWDTARRILDWARDDGDADRDGYLEYETRSSKGAKNQGWKDSGDAIVYDDGRPVPAPIATCELQGYWYAAQQLMALMCGARGELADARAWWTSAADLKARFNRDWWSDREQCVALALDPGKRQVEAVSSNAGHCLATGIVDDEHLPRVVGRLFAPDMFSGWGIRTLSSTHAHYDPISYHRGSVWAVEQATILFGLRRFGFEARAQDLAATLFALASLYPAWRIPECVGGHARGERPTPGAYPRANSPQLWNATAFPLAIQSLLGLVPWAAAGVLLVDPALPEWLPDVTLERLRVGESEVSLRFVRQRNGQSDYDVLHRRGALRIVRQPPLESLSASVADRTWGPITSLFK